MGSDLRISGVQISVCLTSDVRVNFWDPLKIVAATNDYTGTRRRGFFNGTLYLGYSNGYGGSRAWCHGTIGPMTPVQIDLSAYAGTPIQLRWIESDDALIGFTGWYVDDVTVANAAASRDNPLFGDSFENGNLGAWTATTP